MANNQTNVAQVSILATENTTSNVLVSRSFSPSLDAKSGLYGTYINNPAAGTVSLTFPFGITTIYNFYVRNLASAGGGNIQLSITWTGGAAEIITLTPGDIILYWSNQDTLTSAGIGITNVSAVNVAASTATFEYFFGA